MRNQMIAIIDYDAGNIKSVEKALILLGEDVVLEAPDSYISYFYPRTVQLSEYFDEKNTLVFLDEPMRLKERGDGVQAEFEESMKNRLEQGFLLPGQTALLTPAKHVLAAHTLVDCGQRHSGRSAQASIAQHGAARERLSSGVAGSEQSITRLGAFSKLADRAMQNV